MAMKEKAAEKADSAASAPQKAGRVAKAPSRAKTRKAKPKAAGGPGPAETGANAAASEDSTSKPKGRAPQAKKWAAKPKPPAPQEKVPAAGSAELPEALSEIAADAVEVFRYMPDLRSQDRAHAYLVRRRVERGSNDTACEVAVLDMVERAYWAGMKAAGVPIPGVERLAAKLAKAGSDLIEQSAELLSMNGGSCGR